jgi:hypothetical protein
MFEFYWPVGEAEPGLPAARRCIIYWKAKRSSRLNLAISRAQSLAIVVGNPTLARTDVKTLEQMTQVNLFARLCELHTR